jgi:DNA-binding transcriptional regulator LsrR (DeoR family)
MKLTSLQVRDIRYLYYTQGCRQKELAKQFGVHQAHISRIVNGHKRSKI